MDLRMFVKPGQQIRFFRNKFPNDYCALTIGKLYTVESVGTSDVVVTDDKGDSSSIHAEEFLLNRYARNLPDWW